MTSAQSSNTNLSETDFNLLEDSEDADNHTSDTTATRLSLQVQLDESYLGQRIDQVAALVWNVFSREKLKQWLKDGPLLVNGNIVKPKYRCEGTELLTLEVELEAQTTSQPENIPLNVVYEDDTGLEKFEGLYFEALTNCKAAPDASFVAAIINLYAEIKKQ